MNIITSLANLGNALRASSATLNRSTNQNVGSQNNLADQIVKSMTQQTLLLAGIYKLTDALQSAFDLFTDAQKASASLGRVFDLRAGELSPALNSLNGTISQKLSVAFEGLKNGLDINSKEVTNLAVFQKINNQEYKQTLKLFAGLQKQLGFSTEQTDSLAKNIMLASNQYGVASEYIVTSLQGVVSELEGLVFSDTGIQKSVLDSFTQLTAALGETMGSDLKVLAQKLFQSGIEGEVLASKLGVAEARDRFLTAKSATSKFNELINILKVAGETVEGVANSQTNYAAKTEILNQLFGNLAPSLQRIKNRLDEVGDGIGAGPLEKDLTQKLLEAFNPISVFFTDLLSKYRPQIESFIQSIGSVVNSFVAFLRSGMDNITTTLTPLVALFISVQGVLAFMTGSAIVGALSFFGVTLAGVTAVLSPIIVAVLTLTSIIIGVVEIFKAAISTFLESSEGFSRVISPILDIVKQVGSVLLDLGVVLYKLAILPIKLLGSALGKLGAFIFDGIISTLDTVLGLFGESVDSVLEKISNTLAVVSASLELVKRILDDPLGFEYSDTGKIFKELLAATEESTKSNIETNQSINDYLVGQNTVDLTSADSARADYKVKIDAVELAFQARLQEKQIESDAINRLMSETSKNNADATKLINEKFEAMITELVNLNDSNLVTAQSLTNGEVVELLNKSAQNNTTPLQGLTSSNNGFLE